MHNVKVFHMPGNEDLPLPVKMSTGSSGFDLHAAVMDPVEIKPGRWKLIPSGIALSMPAGLEAQVRPRSGLALKHGITVLNTPGTIDADYRGEIGVILLNLGERPFRVERGDRIAQLVFMQVPAVSLKVTDSLDETERGSGGFGHTGK
ncbi:MULTISPECIES: dUTP diphosphatase [Thermoactinomyces]|uniref:Deoxyuridine 5'-triphosphate nucleotidohydrolase n=1 Tax=Thermoactinomyces vulgaris TaxID=2026 RepID=A0ABS0QJZ6_THEVU|nr:MULTISPECIES: dUTP diphosphatase [Thermoactinomyces]KFZ40062.1 deoxyuridine 5'-triphosphate nucleotidohydrolase [Thermoactinomyces sp. Gus2-1]KYQ85927.1 deoxyuridine 5'-triphosphate nucleotidohydrolase [Thermoactinomyces sp. AS95]MBA4552631.1 dUTP diphosphatase [Thermoactinomyces vulgaris]MBA4597736.1 dUTP diphosphatase [Thermoactinomyces vulgaris]MBH8582635.1 dUTP diphosphatase [Thermoactinomyces sp. CICC 10735]